MPDTNIESAREQCGDCCDWKNQWGRVTKLLGVPWEASGGKVMEEIRKLQNAVAACKSLSSSAAMDCGFDAELLFERLAQIEKAANTINPRPERNSER